MKWLRHVSPQTLKWTAIAMFALAFLAVYISQRTTPPTDVVLIIVAIASGITGFMLWIMYGDRVDGGPRR